MKGAGARFLAVAAFVIGFPLAYALPPFAHVPNLVYDPLARRFLVATRPGAIPMGYFGQLLYGAGGGLAAALVTYAIARGARKGESDEAVGLAAAWALTVIALVCAWFAWNNWP